MRGSRSGLRSPGTGFPTRPLSSAAVRRRMLELLAERDAAGQPLRVGLIGAGDLWHDAPRAGAKLRGLEIAGVADVSPERAHAASLRAGFSQGEIAVLDDASALLALEPLDIVVEATGAPRQRGARPRGDSSRPACRDGDGGRTSSLVPRSLSVRGRKASSTAWRTVISLLSSASSSTGRGRQASTSCAPARGRKHLPSYHQATPETVWESYGFSEEQVASGGYNARMFTSFLDGTKSAVEMAAVCNATGLEPQGHGLGFPAAGADPARGGMHSTGGRRCPRAVGNGRGRLVP